MDTILKEYKCPCCGGSITFDSATQKMKCPYCDTEFEVEALKAYDDDLNTDSPDEMDWDTRSDDSWQGDGEKKIRSYVCNSCGGEIITDETTAATSCPFCDSPVIINEHLSGQKRPDIVIPFKLDKETAKNGLRKHFSGKRLLPKIFKDENHIDEIKGIYVPFWLFDADAEANIRYKATQIRHWSTSKYHYTETRYYSVIRGGSIGFNKIPVDGSSKMADDLMESIEPFDMKDAVDFQTAYLSGYFADKYDVDLNDSIGRANTRIKKSTEEAFASTVSNYASVSVESNSIRFSNNSAKYALLPVWILNTTWNGKKYIFAMNGQTGKFAGDLPLDKKAYFKWFGLFAGIFSALFFAIASLIAVFGG